METEFLICTNGREDTWPAIEYGAWAAMSLGVAATLLAITERGSEARADEQIAVQGMAERARRLFEEKGVVHTIQMERGAAEEIIQREAKKRDCVVVLSPLGRPPLRRFFAGRSIRQLLAEVRAPIIYVPRVRLPLRRILICLGGLGFEVAAEHLAIRLGVASRAEVVLLHVAPPSDLDYPTARVERERWRDLADTDTLLGRNLRGALEVARRAGLTAAVTTRQGNIAEEILAEVKGGSYDLVCMGSPYSAHGIRHMYEPNITDEVAEHAGCPVLTARQAS
jgi:nucleotide-binding universal stress UspA family protein